MFGIAGGLIGSAGGDEESSPVTQVGTQTVNVQESSAIIDAAKKVSPAVVSITATVEARTFLGPQSEKAGGTGFIITNDGLIGTNKHVVEASPRSLTVVTSDGRTYPAEVKAMDPSIDFALLKIDAKNLPVVSFGDSDNLEVGQEVIAIGNALGEFQNTVTSGVISAKERSVEASGAAGQATEQLDNLLQTDAAINPGNSGGPLVSLGAQVIGVNTAVAGGGAQGIGFAIPVKQVTQGIESYTKRGKIVRPSLGIRYLTVTREVARLNKLPVDNGAWLVSGRGGQALLPGSAASKAGLRENDIITAVNGQALDERHSLAGLVGKFNPGDEVEITFNREGKEQKVKVRLDER